MVLNFNAELWKKRIVEWSVSGLSTGECCTGQEFTLSNLLI